MRTKELIVSAVIIRSFIYALSMLCDYIIEDKDTSTNLYLKEVGVELKYGKNSLMYLWIHSLFRYDAFFFIRHAY